MSLLNVIVVSYVGLMLIRMMVVMSDIDIQDERIIFLINMIASKMFLKTILSYKQFFAFIMSTCKCRLDS